MGSVTTTVAVVWRPTRYAVRWALSPSEVPQFDPSRGGNPFQMPPVEFADGVWVWPQGGPTLGGTRPPPPPVHHLPVEIPDPTHGSVDMTSIPVANYPRLVREGPGDVGERPGDNHPLEAIAGLKRYVLDDEALMLHARDVMSVYGPLAYGEFDFTLTAWRQAAVELHTHLALLRELSIIAEGEGRPEQAIQLDAGHREALQAAIGELDPELAMPSPHTLRQLTRDCRTLGDMRTALGAAYWAEFRRNTMPYAHDQPFFSSSESSSHLQLTGLGSSPGQLVVRCGCKGWAYYELWQRAVRGTRIHECRGCGRLFQATRQDAKHCQASCRVRSYRRRERVQRSEP